MLIPSFTKTYHHDVYPAIDAHRPQLSASGKTVLVTGAGQGIGAAITNNFALAGAANLVILGRNSETLNAVKSKVESGKDSTSKVHVYQADITDESRINQVFADVVNKIGPVDICIANAGYLPSPGPIAKCSVEEFWRGYEINVKGAFIVTKAFLRAASANPTLINISSGAALAQYAGPFSSYSGSKAGEVRLMDSVAAECPHVRVFNVQPGFIATAMGEKSGINVSPFDSGESNLV